MSASNEESEVRGLICTVTLNPCKDRTWRIERFVYGGMNRIQNERMEYSGKGFNVARAASRLGCDCVATGFLYEDGAEAIRRELQREGVAVDCVTKSGRVRINTKVFDEEKRVVTEFNEAGVDATEQDVCEAVDKITELASNCSLLVLSGSLPPGCPVDVYARIMTRCAEFSCKVLLDAEGEKLAQGIAARPFLVKPNRFELETAVGRVLHKTRDVFDAARAVIAQGVGVVAVSLGAEGALITDGGKGFFAPPVRELAVRGTVAAGDSMVAGFCYALAQDLPLEDMLRCGVAAASDCVTREGSEMVTRDGFDAMLERVDIRKMI